MKLEAKIDYPGYGIVWIDDARMETDGRVSGHPPVGFIHNIGGRMYFSKSLMKGLRSSE